MSEEREGLGSRGPQGQDDEPTLETVTPVPELPPASSGWASRLEKLAAARRERRRRMATRLWYAAIPVVLLVIAAMALLSIFGGLRGDESVVSTSTTVVRHAVEGSGLLLVEEDGTLALAVVLHPWDTGGVVLGVPGITLFESQGSFKTLTEIYLKGQSGAVEGALSEALGMLVGPVAVVEWSDLQGAMRAAKVEGVPEGASNGEQQEAESVARVFREFVGESVSGQGPDLWSGLRMKGNAGGLRDALNLDAASMAADVWTSAVMTGRVVAGEGFLYLEPNVEEAVALLGASSRAAMISVEVKDGAGLTGAAAQAGDLLEAAGYVLLPMSYADAFPEVEQTQIVVAPGNTQEAERLRAVLGVGQVVEDESLGADYIVVVLGKDFVSGSVE